MTAPPVPAWLEQVPKFRLLSIRESIQAGVIDLNCYTQSERPDVEYVKLTDVLHADRERGWQRLLDCIVRMDAVKDLPAPELRAEEDGSIGLDWDHAARCVLSLSIDQQGRLGWAALIGDQKFVGTSQPGEWSPAFEEALRAYAAAVSVGPVLPPAERETP